MAEEFQESEFLFSENATRNQTDHQWYNHHSDSGESQGNSTKIKANRSRNSLPISIPENLWTHQYVETDSFDEFDSDDGDIVPPHVIVGRRLARKMAFSVCSGNGRTLKGRDLSQEIDLSLPVQQREDNPACSYFCKTNKPSRNVSGEDPRAQESESNYKNEMYELNLTE